MIKVFRKILFLIVLVNFLFAYYVVVKVEGANFRQGPGINYKAKWDLEKNFPLLVLKRQGTWYKVKDYLGYIGWINTKMVGPSVTVIISGAKVNLRRGPGRNYQIIGQGYRGQIFRLSRKTKNWARIISLDKGRAAWIHRSLVWGE